mmetsp:Transcript_100061/g.198480  ORF Transcript_100061/g.198480 Transcript_100061/m.198480 type:complete len:132 (+) Transcript_100061:253-648(+)
MRITSRHSLPSSSVQKYMCDENCTTGKFISSNSTLTRLEDGGGSIPSSRANSSPNSPAEARHVLGPKKGLENRDNLVLNKDLGVPVTGLKFADELEFSDEVQVVVGRSTCSIQVWSPGFLRTVSFSTQSRS